MRRDVAVTCVTRDCERDHASPPTQTPLRSIRSALRLGASKAHGLPPSIAATSEPRQSTVGSSYLEHVLQPLHGSHVLGALESPRIGAAELAHAALHLVYRLIF